MNELLLIVEDDDNLREVTRLSLQAEGYRVVEAADGGAGIRAFERHAPDLVLLDVMLPDIDGLDVCRRIRRSSYVPIIMLTARASTFDVVVGLESGADDYVTKPFEVPELLARIRSVMRRTTPRGDESTDEGDGGHERFRLGDLTIDVHAHVVRRSGHEVGLTATEFRLLVELVRHRGQVLSREQLLERVWGYTFLGDSRIVDVHVQRLRAKIERDPASPVHIVTVRGFGYRAGE